MTVFASVLPVTLTRLLAGGKSAWTEAWTGGLTAGQPSQPQPEADYATAAREKSFNEAMDCIWVAAEPHPKDYAALPSLVRKRKYSQAVKRYKQVLLLHVEACVLAIQTETDLAVAISRFRRFAVNCCPRGEGMGWCAELKEQLAEKLVARIQAATYWSEAQRLEFTQQIQSALPR